MFLFITGALIIVGAFLVLRYLITNGLNKIDQASSDIKDVVKSYILKKPERILKSMASFNSKKNGLDIQISGKIPEVMFPDKHGLNFFGRFLGILLLNNMKDAIRVQLKNSIEEKFPDWEDLKKILNGIKETNPEGYKLIIKYSTHPDVIEEREKNNN